MSQWGKRMVHIAESSAEEGDVLLESEPYHRPNEKGKSALKGAAIASASVLLALGVWLCKPHHVDDSSQGVLTGESLEFDALQGGGHACRTSTPGERCFKDVRWAMTEGIHGHPDWYTKDCPELDTHSSFEEFQKCVHKLNKKSCPSMPCKPKPTPKPKRIRAPPHPPSHHTPSRHVQKYHAPAKKEELCQTAKQGDACYKAIVKAMSGSIPGVSQESTLEDVQEALHVSGHHVCARPCKCEMAKPGSQCYKHIQWALKGGIQKHPFWYTGVTKDSSFEEIQDYLHSKNSCPIPCHKVQMGDEPQSKHHFPSLQKKQEDCRTVKADDICHTNVMYGMRRGLFEHPEWYPGLDIHSSFEDFQNVLHKNPDLKCPKPCFCKTAKEGDHCYKNVRWVLTEGLTKHAEWYPNLSNTSRWEDVQAQLVTDKHAKCDAPCTPKAWGTPSLYCFSIFRSSGYEMDLVKSQLAKGVGIFNCDEFAILSDQKLALPSGINTLIVRGIENTAVSKDGTSANTDIFLQAWNVIAKDHKYKAHDWVIKADPDAVIIVPRLRSHLAPHNGKNVFMQNCMKYEGPGWPTLFGSLEAFSHKAIETYFTGVEKCKRELQWRSWGEDLFMNSCLTHLGVKPAFDGDLIGDNVCKGADCQDGTSASYHPFKSPEAWFQCYSQATGVTVPLKK